MGRSTVKRICQVRSFDFRQASWITQGFLRFPYGFLSLDLLMAGINKRQT
jgi:hypothetical protein